MSGFRMARIGLLVAFLILLVTLHGRGAAYNDFHVIYLVLLVGLLAFSFTRRRGQRPMGQGRWRNGSGGQPGNQPSGRGSFGTAPPPPPPPAQTNWENPDPESGDPPE